MRRGRLQPLVWPVVLLAVGTGLMLAGQGLAYLDGFRFYGQVGGMGELVAAIGGIWLMVVGIRRLLEGPQRRRRP